jgi:hypothetical protein
VCNIILRHCIREKKYVYIIGQYKQNTCSANATSCIPCKDRLPSCVGLQDGDHPVPSQLWGPQYITCYKNRTVNATRCQTGSFSPKSRTCVSKVDKRTFQYILHVIIISNFFFFQSCDNTISTVNIFTWNSVTISKLGVKFCHLPFVYLVSRITRKNKT